MIYFSELALISMLYSIHLHNVAFLEFAIIVKVGYLFCQYETFHEKCNASPSSDFKIRAIPTKGYLVRNWL